MLKTITREVQIQSSIHFCLEPTTSNRNTTGMYNSLGWTIEKTWRGHKHWDKVQSSMRFRGEYSPKYTLQLQ